MITGGENPIFGDLMRKYDEDIYTSSLDTDHTRNTRAPHFTPQHWLLCHMGLY